MKTRNKNKKLDFLFSVFWVFRGSKFGIRDSKRGFALIELLIAVLLFGVISTFVVFAYNKVSGQLFVTTLAYELALSFRQAQSYGVSVHQFKVDTDETFNVGYGLHFDVGNAKTYLLFADKGGAEGDKQFNGAFGIGYNAGGCLNTSEHPECVSVFRLEKGNTIDKFCGVLSDDGGRDVADAQKHEECSRASTPPDAPAPPISFLDVTFVRPNPDANMRTSESAEGRQYKAARVYLSSPSGEKRVVEVVNTGQISIK